MFRLQHDWFRSFESQGDDKFWVVDPDGTKYIVKTNAGKVVDAPQDLTVLHSNGVMSVSTRTSTVKAHSPLATSSVSSYANLTAATESKDGKYLAVASRGFYPTIYDAPFKSRSLPQKKIQKEETVESKHMHQLLEASSQVVGIDDDIRKELDAIKRLEEEEKLRKAQEEERFCGAHVLDGRVGSNEPHYDDISFMEFFPSSKVLLTCSADMQLKIWECKTSFCGATLRGHSGGVNCAAMIGNGRTILSCSTAGEGFLWDVPTQKVVSKPLNLKRRQNITKVSFNEKTCVGVFSAEGVPGAFRADLRGGGGAWHALTDSTANCFYGEYSCLLGCKNGKLLQYDLRSPDTPLKTMSLFSSPVSTVSAKVSNGVECFVATSAHGEVVRGSAEAKEFELFSGANLTPIVNTVINDTMMVATKEGELFWYNY